MHCCRFFSRSLVGRRTTRSVFLSILGFLTGFSTILLFQLATDNFNDVKAPLFDCPEGLHGAAVPKSQLILVGIMTAAKYVDSRAYNVWRTWAQRIPGKVLFFVAEDTYSIYPELPLIRLKGVDDSYPPQKKSFAMMRWMFDNYLDDFDWFLRADDDLYVRGDQLETFLRSLDPTKPHFLGQAGLGNSAEYGLLSLGQRDNYCMGGPGVVFSREALRLVAPHLQSCLLELLTTHEDVELGRCVRKHVGIACSWNYEMQILFHNNQSTPEVFQGWGTNPELKHAITLHPVKKPEVMRLVHRENLIMKIRELRALQLKLAQFKSTGPKVNLIRRVANSTNDLAHWDYTALNKITFCAKGINCPRHTQDFNVKNALEIIVNDLFDGFNSNARQRGRLLQFQSIQYAYMRLEPRHGVDYVLDIILWFKKFRPPHRATLSVRKHSYVQQTFGELEAIRDVEFRRILKSGSEFYGNMSMEEREVALNEADSERVHLIVPLRGRAATFKRFCDNIVDVVPPSEKDVELVLVLYNSGDATDDSLIRSEANALSAVLAVRVIEMGDEEFSRGKALKAGSDALSPESLMFFTDVDMLFNYDVLQRIRQNTVLGAQIYFPIVFSEFAPESWSSTPDEPTSTHFAYGRRRGYFRHFGFGLVSLYRRDFESVGGFNLTIRGWGMEDVNLFEKVIASNLRVMRAPEPGLVHVYHPIHCAPDMPEAQHAMCRGSKAQSLASLDFLAEKVLPHSV